MLALASFGVLWTLGLALELRSQCLCGLLFVLALAFVSLRL